MQTRESDSRCVASSTWTAASDECIVPRKFNHALSLSLSLQLNRFALEASSSINNHLRSKMNDFFHPSGGSRARLNATDEKGGRERDERAASSSKVGPKAQRCVGEVMTPTNPGNNIHRLQPFRNFRGTSTPSWIDLQGRALGRFPRFREFPRSLRPSARVSRGNYVERLRNELIRARNWISALDEREALLFASPRFGFRIPDFVVR